MRERLKYVLFAIAALVTYLLFIYVWQAPPWAAGLAAYATYWTCLIMDAIENLRLRLIVTVTAPDPVRVEQFDKKGDRIDGESQSCSQS